MVNLPLTNCVASFEVTGPLVREVNKRSIRVGQISIRLSVEDKENFFLSLFHLGSILRIGDTHERRKRERHFSFPSKA